MQGFDTHQANIAVGALVEYSFVGVFEHWAASVKLLAFTLNTGQLLYRSYALIKGLCSPIYHVFSQKHYALSRIALITPSQL